MHLGRHSIESVGWSKVAVLGANDGIVSTASLVLSMTSVNTSPSGVLLAGVAGLVTGAMSMATEGYVSVSSRANTETAALAEEGSELDADYQGEVRESAPLYIQRGVEPALARQVAERLMTKDASEAHAREELGSTDTHSTRPSQTVIFPAVSSSAEVGLPLIVTVLSPAKSAVIATFLSTLCSLAVLGYFSSVVNNTPPVRAINRITFWSALAMFFSIGIGCITGQILL